MSSAHTSGDLPRQTLTMDISRSQDFVVLESQRIITMNTTSIVDFSLALSSSTTESTDSETSETRTVTVRNEAAFPAGFILLPTLPTFHPLNIPDLVRISIYQSSLRVAAETGSHTFVIPLPGTKNEPTIFAITGCDRQAAKEGRVLYCSDVVVLKAGLEAVEEGASSCRMTMPEGYEPCFVKDRADIKASSTPGSKLGGSWVSIQVDNSFRYPAPDGPFVGIGAPNPYNNSREIIPLCTWSAKPGHRYIFRADYRQWRMMQGLGKPGAIMVEVPDEKSTVFTFPDEKDEKLELIHGMDGTFSLPEREL
ncbi:hypothetical protein BJ508DRAFT_357317 [Ascobolus immersus RN42]|uniref:Uncharacterized protein n=1 Tax=Ascobolus immersus RN42 TaxID=1160509 RepID=A0A3N4J1B0_ASCIM|nr:hypothetical protein BJ508DRAFT_357317 [Ascobolus immersus RN42]